MDEEARRRLARFLPDGGRRYRTCQEKMAYETLHDALLMREWRKQRAGVDLSYYHCPYGDHYHLTKQSPSPEQAAQLRSEWEAESEGCLADLEAYPARRDALLNQIDAVGREIERRARRLARLQPSLRLVSEVTERYKQQRNDLIREDELVEQLVDLKLRRDLILARSEIIVAHRNDFWAAMPDWQERREVLEAAVEQDRQALVAGLHGRLAKLDVMHAENLAQAREYLTRHYLRSGTSPTRQ